MSNLRRGIRAERALARQLRAQGYDVTRSAASRGYDLIATSGRDVIYISVKSHRRMVASILQRAETVLRRAQIPRSPVVKRQLWWYQPYQGWHAKNILTEGARRV